MDLRQIGADADVGVADVITCDKVSAIVYPQKKILIQYNPIRCVLTGTSYTALRSHTHWYTSSSS